jgi:maltose alpha-D-glucosyltransferase/alpha-amylase
MGENIWLEDRDGVRTPMQWTDGPSAGFSSAPPDELYLPLIEGEYGPDAVNVEDAVEDADSLLNRLRSLIHVRKEHAVFGRGELVILHPENEAVLAYVRVGVDVAALVVNNLSPEPQSVELDLGDYAGRVPVDLVSGETLPGIEGTYTLELPRYGFRWLRLE